MMVGPTDQPRDAGAGSGVIVRKIAHFSRSLQSRYPSALQSLLSIFDQAIVSGTSFFSAAIIGRMTTPDQLGLYYLVLSIVVFGAAIQDSAVSAPYLVYCKRRQGRELDEYSGSALVQLLAFCAICVIALLLIDEVLQVTIHPKILPGLWALLGAAPLILLRQGIRRISFANLHVTSVILLDTIVAVVQLGGLLVLGYLDRLSLTSIFAVMGGACGLACLGIYLFDPPRVRFVRERFMSDWQVNWAFSKWTLRGYLVGSTTPFAMLWILGLAVGPASAGVFGACSTLVGLTNVLLMGVDNVLTPQASHAFTAGGKRKLSEVLLRAGAILVAAIGPFCLFVILTGDWLATFVFGNEFRGTGGILLALALGALVNCFGVVVGNGLWAVDQPRSNFLGDIYSMAVTLIAAAILIPMWGALGAALASLAGTSAGTIARGIIFIQYLRTSSSEPYEAAAQSAVRGEVATISRPASDVAGEEIAIGISHAPEAIT